MCESQSPLWVSVSLAAKRNPATLALPLLQEGREGPEEGLMGHRFSSSLWGRLVVKDFFYICNKIMSTVSFSANEATSKT